MVRHGRLPGHPDPSSSGSYKSNGSRAMSFPLGCEGVGRRVFRDAGFPNVFSQGHENYKGNGASNELIHSVVLVVSEVFCSNLSPSGTG